MTVAGWLSISLLAPAPPPGTTPPYVTASTVRVAGYGISLALSRSLALSLALSPHLSALSLPLPPSLPLSRIPTLSVCLSISAPHPSLRPSPLVSLSPLAHFPSLLSLSQVVRVADFGAFVEMEGFSKWGLVHVTQLVDNAATGGGRVRTWSVCSCRGREQYNAVDKMF